MLTNGQNPYALPAHSPNTMAQYNQQNVYARQSTYQQPMMVQAQPSPMMIQQQPMQ